MAWFSRQGTADFSAAGAAVSRQAADVQGSGRSPLLCHLGQLLVDFPGGLHLHHQQQDQLIPHPQQDGPHRQDHQAQGPGSETLRRTR